MLGGINCGMTSKLNTVIPRAEGVYQFSRTPNPLHTYSRKIEGQRGNCCYPTPVTYDPAPPNLRVGTN
jgi:hypothetical protein